MRAATARSASRRHTSTDVVDAALSVLDEHGLPNLSMRTIADLLGMHVSGLYWHFSSKQTLLAALCERILLGPATRATGDDDLMSIAVDLRDCLLAYRDGAELVSSSLALGLIDPPQRHYLHVAALRSGLAESEADVAADTLVLYVIGATFHEQQRLQADAAGVAMNSAVALTVSELGSEADSFQAGLRLIIAGIQATARARDEVL